MKVHFIKHSSFLLEFERYGILFDYYEGELPYMDKPLYVFASHSHPDHFSEEVFRVTQGRQEVLYILSDDIFKRRVPAERQEQTRFTQPNESGRVGNLQYRTLRSTDKGVAFLVETEEGKIYHAGDLNCWVWPGSELRENEAAEKAYLAEMEHLKGERLLTAFVPLDPRQEEFYDRGMRHFLAAAECSHVFPMHMWGDFSVIGKYKRQYPGDAKRLQDIAFEGQCFTF